MSAKTCPHCNCSDIDVDQSRGVACCTGCGSVLENNIIVSEVQFEENGFGGNSVVGQFVNLDGRMSRRTGAGIGFGRESRAITLENGRRKIMEVAEQLRINQHCIDSAFNIFKIAIHRNFTKGRPHGHVIAACLYIICRLQGTAHMLLDFSDVLQVNVYELGKTYLKLANDLCINVPTLDPCMYVIRFAHHLQFKDQTSDKTHEVITTTLRLLQRMKRDWMHIGRRPSGLCGAALLVAARMHDFNRTVNDIIKVVKVCTATLRKRLIEFGDTPSSRLTLEEFKTIDLEEEQDPPAFKLSRKKAKLQHLDEETKEVSKLQKEIEKLLDEKKKKLKGIYETEKIEANDAEREEIEAAKFVEEETLSAITKFVGGGDLSFGSLDKAIDEENSSFTAQESESNWNAHFSGNAVASIGLSAAGLSLTGASLDLNACNVKRKREDEEETEESGILDLEGIDDKELDTYILTPQEAKRKTVLWHTINADYLKELKEKEEREAKLLEEGLGKPEKKKRKVNKKSNVTANSAGEAIEKMLQEKKISNKINYDVLRSLNSSFAMPSTSESIPAALTIPTTSTTSKIEPKQPIIENESSVLQKIDTVSVIMSMEDMPLVVENGPISYDDDKHKDDEYDEDEDQEEDEEMCSTAELLRKHRGEDYNNENEFEDYDDYYD